METKEALSALSALGHAQRLEIFRHLVKVGPQGAVAGEIASALSALPNTLSANLSLLAQAGLVEQAREGRNMRYRARMDAMQGLVDFLLEDCCGGDVSLCSPAAGRTKERSGVLQDGGPMTPKTYNVLFLCTGNSARSIIAEACLSREGLGKFNAFSAGSQPAGEVNPYAIQLLEKQNFNTKPFRSKSWDEYAGPDAPVMDFVFTVCDNAAKEVCPVWPGQPMTAHWGVADPAKVEGNETETALAFADTFRMLRHRISIFCNLPLESLDRLSLQKQVDEIGKE
jgi:arsenate reductase